MFILYTSSSINIFTILLHFLCLPLSSPLVCVFSCFVYSSLYHPSLGLFYLFVGDSSGHLLDIFIFETPKGVLFLSMCNAYLFCFSYSVSTFISFIISWFHTLSLLYHFLMPCSSFISTSYTSFSSCTCFCSIFQNRQVIHFM